MQGDTTNTFVASLAGFYHKIPVGHIEARLRIDDRYYPFPEEINRRLTSTLSTIHFAPAEHARKNLLKEGVADSSIMITGNTVIDALHTIIQRKGYQSAESNRSNKEILVTAHRRES